METSMDCKGSTETCVKPYRLIRKHRDINFLWYMWTKKVLAQLLTINHTSRLVGLIIQTLDFRLMQTSTNAGFSTSMEESPKLYNRTDCRKLLTDENGKLIGQSLGIVISSIIQSNTVISQAWPHNQRPIDHRFRVSLGLTRDLGLLHAMSDFGKVTSCWTLNTDQHSDRGRTWRFQIGRVAALRNRNG